MAELRDADDVINAVEVGDDVEAHLGVLVLQLGDEQGDQVLNCVGFSWERIFFKVLVQWLSKE